MKKQFYLLGFLIAGAFTVASALSMGILANPTLLAQEWIPMVMIVIIIMLPFGMMATGTPSKRTLHILGAVAAVFWTIFLIAAQAPVIGANMGLGFLGLASPFIIGFAVGIIEAALARRSQR